MSMNSYQEIKELGHMLTATEPVDKDRLHAITHRLMAIEKKEAIMGAVARGWCHDENAHKTMDTELALAITDEVLKLGE